ncbi:MAG: transketolase [Bacteroidales bacterium]|nr:transketolase [Bacteroidales bacterium]
MTKENPLKILELQLQAEKIREKVVDMIFSSKSGHIGGSLSSVDINTALYFHIMNIDPENAMKEDRDRFILSKGHSVEALYAVLAARGFIRDSLLETYGQFNSVLEGHPTKNVPGVEHNSGALGHGLSVGVGMAIAAKMDNRSYRTYVLMGDGEQGEGSVYEAAMSASHYKLDNLIAIIDRNELQISGNTEEVMMLEPIRERWEAFGWEVYDVDGNNIGTLVDNFASLDFSNKKPKLIIAHTIKGCGISFMESLASWHHGVVNEKQYEEAISEINERIKNLRAKITEYEKR